MRVLVTGSRNLRRYGDVYAVLDEMHRREPITLVIQGGARGADAAAEAWAEMREIPCLRVPAKWKQHGCSAGPIRNRSMLNLFGLVPEICVAFPGGDGTADMKAAAAKAGIAVREVAP